MDTGLKQRIKHLEQQARAAQPNEARIAWVDEDGRIVGYTIVPPAEDRRYLPNGMPRIDYRDLIEGGKYYVECKSPS